MEKKENQPEERKDFIDKVIDYYLNEVKNFNPEDLETIRVKDVDEVRGKMNESEVKHPEIENLNQKELPERDQLVNIVIAGQKPAVIENQSLEDALGIYHVGYDQVVKACRRLTKMGEEIDLPKLLYAFHQIAVLSRINGTVQKLRNVEGSKSYGNYLESRTNDGVIVKQINKSGDPMVEAERTNISCDFFDGVDVLVRLEKQEGGTSISLAIDTTSSGEDEIFYQDKLNNSFRDPLIYLPEHPDFGLCLRIPVSVKDITTAEDFLQKLKTSLPEHLHNVLERLNNQEISKFNKAVLERYFQAFA